MKLKKIIGWLVYIIVLFALAYGIPKILAYALDSKYPMAAITSNSMWPVLKKGDLVLIEGIESRSEVEVGDIVVYRNPQGFTIHRIVKLNENKITTKGDANNSFDPSVEYEEIIGKTVVFGEKPVRIPLLGSISIFINQFLINKLKS